MFSSFFFSFWLRKLLSATRTAKYQKSSRKTKRNKTNKKKQRILRNVWAKDFVQRHCFFLCVFFKVFLGFFWFLAPGAFIGYWDCQESKKQKESKKNGKTQCSQECLGPGLSSEALFFLVCVFLVFVFLLLVPAPQKTNLFSFKPYHPWILYFFLLCSMLRVAVAKKSTQTKVMRDKVWRIISFVLLQALFRSIHTLNNTTINHNMFLFAARKNNNRNKKHKKALVFKEMWEPIYMVW